jgi:hypothetical protein
MQINSPFLYTASEEVTVVETQSEMEVRDVLGEVVRVEAVSQILSVDPNGPRIVGRNAESSLSGGRGTT